MVVPPYLPTTFFTCPTFFWISPAISSACPSASRSASFVSCPAFSFTFPFNLCSTPSTSSCVPGFIGFLPLLHLLSLLARPWDPGRYCVSNLFCPCTPCGHICILCPAFFPSF